MVERDLALTVQRRLSWHQTPETRIGGPDDGARLIDRVGIATLFPASPEVPNLFHAYSGDPGATTDAGHDSPSGEVYSWRWTLGKREAAFYSVLVRNRPTWVSWPLVPAILRLCGETRTPDDLYAAGVISRDAHRVARVLDEAGTSLATGEVRRRAGFPTGKAERAAYLKAVDELDRRLIVAKVFTPDAGDLAMHHALVRTRYPTHVATAERLTTNEALDALLAAYGPTARYIIPPVLAAHLRLPGAALQARLSSLTAAGQLVTMTWPGQAQTCYRWVDTAPGVSPDV